MRHLVSWIISLPRQTLRRGVYFPDLDNPAAVWSVYTGSFNSQQLGNLAYRAIEMDEEIFELHADVCRTLSNSKRLRILNALRDGEMPVSRIQAAMGSIGKANLSQHLAVMRQKGVVATRRDGNRIYYRISSAKIIQACDLIREVLFEQLAGKRVLLLRYANAAGAQRGRHTRTREDSRSSHGAGLRKVRGGARSQA